MIILCDLDSFEVIEIAMSDASDYNIINSSYLMSDKVPMYSSDNKPIDGAKLVMLREEPEKGYYVIDASMKVYPVGYLQYTEWKSKYKFVDLQPTDADFAVDTEDSVFGDFDDSFDSEENYNQQTVEQAMTVLREKLTTLLAKYEMMGMSNNARSNGNDLLFANAVTKVLSDFFITNDMSALAGKDGLFIASDMSIVPYDSERIKTEAMRIVIPGLNYIKNPNLYEPFINNSTTIVCLSKVFFENKGLLRVCDETLYSLVLDPKTTITSINRFTYKNLKLLSVLKFPDSVKEICDSVFARWKFDGGVDLNKVERLGKDAFAHSSITGLTMPCIKYIGKSAFNSAYVYNFATKTGDNAVMDFATSCEEIDDKAFKNANLSNAKNTDGMIYLKFGKSLKRIGNSAFSVSNFTCDGILFKDCNVKLGNEAVMVNNVNAKDGKSFKVVLENASFIPESTEYSGFGFRSGIDANSGIVNIMSDSKEAATYVYKSLATYLRDSTFILRGCGTNLRSVMDSVMINVH